MNDLVLNEIVKCLMNIGERSGKLLHHYPCDFNRRLQRWDIFGEKFIDRCESVKIVRDVEKIVKVARSNVSYNQEM